MAKHLSGLKEKYAVPCPVCLAEHPDRVATPLMPQRRCPVDGHRDIRPKLTQAQWIAG
ncbi:MAG: hypothetical protein K2W93_09130 [Burkholderiaceae bacterium]|nr:hypothetical protein [Burkholderiaceae bacterium]